MTTYNITTTSGDTCQIIEFTVTVDAVPLDLTGATITVQANPSQDGSAAISLSTGGGLTITNAVGGVFRINSQVIKAQPGIYNYFIKFFLSNGQVHTYISGTWTVLWKG
jgi:hypothetical protein